MKRLKVGAVLGNTPTGVLVADIQEFDGGPFELISKRFENGIVIVDPNRPASYGLQIQGTPEALKQLGNALLSVARSSAGESDTNDESDAE
jgi:hypothetical protein